jgi:hypothetical protein
VLVGNCKKCGKRRLHSEERGSFGGEVVTKRARTLTRTGDEIVTKHAQTLTSTDDISDSSVIDTSKDRSEMFSHSARGNSSAVYSGSISRGGRVLEHGGGFSTTFSAPRLTLQDCSDAPRLAFKEIWKYDTGKCVDASPLIAMSRYQLLHKYMI